jgi:gliding motility-associated-like protein
MKQVYSLPTQFFFFLGIVLLSLIAPDVRAQLSVNNTLTPAQLVQNILVGGGVTVSNITYSGTLTSYASFTNGGTTNLGLADGVIMCTGNATDIPQAASVLMSTDLSGPSDANLDNLTSGGTHDATVLEFDFIPLSDTIKFRYVFGSEEYHDYVNSNYNDVFGFFVTGPNPLGGNYNSFNIAKIPGTNLPVAINNVNNGYSGNACSSGPCNNCAYFIDNCNNTTIVCDGFTTVLTAWCPVTPCVQYHIKLAIADVGDGVLDSGVFLEANSFSTNGINFNTSYTSNIDTATIEGCNNAIISFMLNQPATDSMIINYVISGTAIEGTDYPFVPDSLVIPPGQDSVSFMISPISDGIPESLETIYIVYQNTTCGGTDTIFIKIKDYPPIFALYTDYYSCSGQTVNINIGTTGGYPPVSYVWDGGLGTGPSITVSPTDSTVYLLSISDACGFSQTDSVNVFVSNIAASISTSDSVTCYGFSDGSTSVITVDGFLPYTYNWSPLGGSASTASNIPAGNYTVLVTDLQGCTSSASTVIYQPPILSALFTSVDSVNCYGESNGSITASASGGIPGYIYQWNSNPIQYTPIASNLIAGSYTITITDHNGCDTIMSTSVYQPTDLSLAITPQNEGCEFACDGQVSVAPSGGTGSYIYFWSTNQTTQTITNLCPGTYSVTVSDANGCSELNNASVATTTFLSASAVANPTNGPIPLNVNFNFTGSGANTYSWNFGDPGSSDNTSSIQNPTHSYHSTGTYFVILTVNSGSPDFCIDTVNITIVAELPSFLNVSNVFTPNGDGKNDLFTFPHQSIETFDCIIFNRWGKKIYEWTDVAQGWDGKTEGGKDANDGVYYYIINARGVDSVDYNLHGTVTVLR